MARDCLPARSDKRRGPDRAFGRIDSNHNRRVAFGNWHCRHRSHSTIQHNRHVGQGSGGDGRCPDYPARQDRHNYHRQPAGDGVHSDGRLRPGNLSAGCFSPSCFDSTPEGRMIVARTQQLGAATDSLSDRAQRFDFSAQTGMSGVDLPDGSVIRKGAIRAVAEHIADKSNALEPSALKAAAASVASRGATPLVVAGDPHRDGDRRPSAQRPRNRRTGWSGRLLEKPNLLFSFR